jgi:L-amino acid N-acyltransferase YncA
MSIRPATRNDIPAIVDILTKAFWDEDAVGRFMHPRREDFPDDLKKFWRRGLRSIWWEEGHSLLVAVNRDGVIVGYANWKVFGGKFEPP